LRGRLRPVPLCIAALLSGLLAPGCADRGEMPSGHPNVLLYLIDTLRSDHLGCYGYPRPTSPVIDDFSREAILFERAYAQASWTRPSVASVLTGLYPSRHGAIRREHRLRGDVTMLAEVLSEAGYHTAAFVSNPNVLPVFGFDRGFEVFRDVGSAGGKPSSRDVNAAVFEYLDRRPKEGPLFLFVHTMDPHDYEPPQAFLDRFERMRTARNPSVARVTDLYDGAIAHNNHSFGVLLDRLEAEGIGDETLVVLLADHGEELADHGNFFHGQTLFQEQLLVPLLFRLPGGALGGRRVARPVRLVDVMPTLLELLGLSAPSDLDGESFAALLRGEGDGGYDPVLFAEQNLGTHVLSALIEGNEKVIVRQRPRRRRSTLLFDLSRDPREHFDLARASPETARRLERRLHQLESTLSGGLYVELVNDSDSGSVEEVDLVAEPDRGGVELLDWSAEEGDTARVEDGGGRLVVHSLLRNLDNPTGEAPAVLVDTDRARLRPSPETEKIRIHVEVGGRPAAEWDLQLGSLADEPHRVRLPATVELGDPRLAAPDRAQRALPHRSRPYVRVYRVSGGSGEVVEIGPELEQRLRALGYASDAPASSERPPASEAERD
jgi:arylsulfatase A-like enzyme